MNFEILEHEPLSRHTSFAIGGPARYFARIRSLDDLSGALAFVRENALPLYVLGGGSNVLVSDEGFDGMVLKMEDRSFEIRGTDVYAAAGAVLAMVSKTSVDAGLSGLEWAYGVPGTIGGAVRGNAGAFGSDTASVLVSVTYINPDTGRLEEAIPERLSYQYRRSLFADTSWIITHAVFRMTPSTVEECTEKLNYFLNLKRERQPLGNRCAGSVFKNTAVTSVRSDISLPLAFLETGRVPSGYLIEQSQMKNHVVGRAMVSPIHGNFIVNLGGATCADVLQLIQEIKDRVYDRFGIELEEEIQFVGPIERSRPIGAV